MKVAQTQVAKPLLFMSPPNCLGTSPLNVFFFLKLEKQACNSMKMFGSSKCASTLFQHNPCFSSLTASCEDAERIGASEWKTQTSHSLIRFMLSVCEHSRLMVIPMCVLETRFWVHGWRVGD